MASEKRPLTVTYSRAALRELQEIWQWNADHYSPDHADAYVSFLQNRIDALSREYYRGLPVAGRPGYRYMTILRRPKSHGHIAVYNVDPETIHILHVFHTSQDWRNKIGDESC